MEDYQMLDSKCKELKEENKFLQDSIQLLKAELAHTKQFEQAIEFLKETSLQQNSRITELETQLSKAHTKENDLQLQLSLKQTKVQLMQSQL